jgi:hypothetical protein
MDLEEWVAAVLDVMSGGSSSLSSASSECLVQGTTSMDLVEEAVSSFRKMEQMREKRGSAVNGFVEWTDLLDLLIEEMSPSKLMAGDIQHLTHSGRMK